MADPGWPGRHFGNRRRVWIMRPLRRGWTSACSHSSVYRHAASRPRGSLVSLVAQPKLLSSTMAVPPRTRSLHRVLIPGCQGGRTLAAQPILQDAANGDSILRRRLSDATEDEFSPLSDLLAAGMTDYAAIITRFGADGIIGEMDGVYSSWTTGGPVDSTMAKSTPFSASRHTSRLPSNRYRSRA